MNANDRKALRKALLIPTFLSHINRKKAAWKDHVLTEETLHTWVKHKTVDLIARNLHKRSLAELFKMLPPEDLS